MTEETLDCFLLSRHWRDTDAGLELTLWAATGRGPLRITVSGERAVCFVERSRTLDAAAPRGVERRAVALRSLEGRPVDALYLARQRELAQLRAAAQRAGLRLYESDLKPVDRYLMERFITAAFTASGALESRAGHLAMRDPRLRRADGRLRLRSLALDVESEGLDGPLYSIAASTVSGGAGAGPDARAGAGVERVFIVADASLAAPEHVVAVASERELLRAFYAWLREVDPDLLIGWNVIGFDLDLIERRGRDLDVPFSIGRGGERATVLAAPGPGAPRSARVPGRVVLDGIEWLRAAFWRFESFALEDVAQSLLGRGKAIEHPGDRLQEIRRLYAEDPCALAAYNLEDCRLVNGIFERTGLLDFVQRRAELTGLAMDRLGGSVAAFDNLYLPRLHRRGRVAPDVGATPGGPDSPGGYVLDSRPGLYRNVLLLDFKSLYPSIIRTFRIDPLGLAAPGDDPVPGFLEARFAREGGILPELIESLWAERDAAKRRRDAPMSQAVKILMNSFYGVLGARGCRFHDARLATSITRRGHQIIRESREFIEGGDAGAALEVIYGDTDSLFVWLGDGCTEHAARAAGTRLAAALNGWWARRLREELDLDSCLEIEFETLFSRFLMPTVRGDSTGSKKRYAGLVRGVQGEPELVFKGLESVRTDWTPLARRFQRELYRRVFTDQPYADFVRETLASMLAGAADHELVYSKRLRRPLESYVRNAPPHVQAARKLAKAPRTVRYVITANGPEPVVGELPRPDYAHYRERQLAPAANGLLHFLDTSFEALTDAQLAIF